MRQLIAVVGVLAFGLIAVGASASGAHPAAPAAPAAARPLATADPANTLRADIAHETGREIAPDLSARRHVARVSGLILPIEGASIPDDPELLPNAPRDYRAGWHEGIDFAAARGTPVRAVAPGVVVRIDRDFVDWSVDALTVATDQAKALGYTPEETLDRIRGRQVWLDHGSGVVTRYAHLDSVADLRVGTRVRTGDVIGAVGSSGFEEGGPHLHFEIRVGDDYLGDGLEGDELLRTIARAFE
jgi:murein DD-endopeptidase MepM/ murein hydrolase activator NlpD